MLDRTYPEQVCSVARALEVVGERWTLLILRDALLGVRRFDDFQGNLGLARSVLTARLNRLVEEGVLERRRYQSNPDRFEYLLTPKGRELGPVIFHLMKWGDSHYPTQAGPPRLALHTGCGGKVDAGLRCASCRKQVAFADLELRPGPGLQANAREREGSVARAAAGRK
jgi:DNA-binding HxlR family transcriptional regulator